MGLRLEERLGALGAFIGEAAGAENATIRDHGRLSGGAIRDNYFLDAEIAGGSHAGRHALVLRTAAPSGIPESHDPAAEFRLLEAACRAGVKVPEPMWLCLDETVLGYAFCLLRRIAGTTSGARIVREEGVGGPPAALAEALGAQLAIIHGIVPSSPHARDLQFLTQPEPGPALAAVARYRATLDSLARPYPALEWGLRWLEVNAPPPGGIVLTHGDFRTGNYAVDENGLIAILDWEFAGWGEAMSDIGWFCARCWRFGADGREAGGIAGRAPFYAGYEGASGQRIDRDAVHYWEVMAHVRWAAIAILQGERHASGAEPSLALALTGRRPAALELEILDMTAPDERAA